MAKSFPMKKIKLGIPAAILGASIALLLTLGGAFAYVLMGSREIAVSATHLTLDGTLYSKQVDRASIDVSGVRVVDLDKATDLAISSKSNGFGLPGLREGYFDLANGKRAFVMLTDEARVVVVPTSDEWLLFSAADPESVVAQLANPSGAR